MNSMEKGFSGLLSTPLFAPISNPSGDPVQQIQDMLNSGKLIDIVTVTGNKCNELFVQKSVSSYERIGEMRKVDALPDQQQEPNAQNASDPNMLPIEAKSEPVSNLSDTIVENQLKRSPGGSVK